MNGAGWPTRELMKGLMNDFLFLASLCSSPVGLCDPAPAGEAWGHACVHRQGLPGPCKGTREQEHGARLFRDFLRLMVAPRTHFHLTGAYSAIASSCRALPSHSAPNRVPVSSHIETAPRPRSARAPSSASSTRPAATRASLLSSPSRS